MIKSLTRASLLALFGTAIFAAAAMAPPPASADWVGEIAPGEEQSAGQAQASGFADENGLISIPTPAQVGDTEEAIFRGSGAVNVIVSDRTMLIVEETLNLTGLQLTISTSRTSTPLDPPILIISHAIDLRRVDQTGAAVEHLLVVSISGTDADGVSAFVRMTGSFDCSGTICNGPQDGELSFSLEVLAPPE